MPVGDMQSENPGPGLISSSLTEKEEKFGLGFFKNPRVLKYEVCEVGVTSPKLCKYRLLDTLVWAPLLCKNLPKLIFLQHSGLHILAMFLFISPNLC